MTLSPLIVGTLPEHPSFLETVTYQVNGLIIVFIVLGALWLLLEIIGRVFRRRAVCLAKPDGAAQSAMHEIVLEPAATTGATGPASHVLNAVIVAAVHVALGGRRHRVVGISPAGKGHGTATQHSSAWAAEGRRDIFVSHKIR